MQHILFTGEFKLTSDLYFSFVVIASSDLHLTTSQKIVNAATKIAKLLGYHGADEPCVKICRYGICKICDRSVLECDPSFKIKGGYGVGVCKVKSWIAYIISGLMIVFAAALFLGCICCCCAC